MVSIDIRFNIWLAGNKGGQVVAPESNKANDFIEVEPKQRVTLNENPVEDVDEW